MSVPDFILIICHKKHIFKRQNSKRIVTYILVGGTAFTCEYICFLVLLQVLNGPSGLLASQCISFCVGILVSFFGNKVLTFSSETHVKSSGHQFLEYVLLALTNLILSVMIIFALVNLLGIGPILAKIAVMGMVAAWNYNIMTKLVFR